MFFMGMVFIKYILTFVISLITEIDWTIIYLYHTKKAIYILILLYVDEIELPLKCQSI